MNVIMFDVFSMSKASVNWTAPEIFAPGDTDFKPTFASDIYALGMLVYEVTCPGCNGVMVPDPSLSPVGAHRTLPVLQTRQSGIGIPSRSGGQATASATGLREVGNHGFGMGYDGNMLG